MHAQPAQVQRLLPPKHAHQRTQLGRKSRRFLCQTSPARQEFLLPLRDAQRHQERSVRQEAEVYGLRAAGRAVIPAGPAGAAEPGPEPLEEPEVQVAKGGPEQAQPSRHRNQQPI